MRGIEPGGYTAGCISALSSNGWDHMSSGPPLRPMLVIHRLKGGFERKDRIPGQQVEPGCVSSRKCFRRSVVEGRRRTNRFSTNAATVRDGSLRRAVVTREMHHSARLFRRLPKIPKSIPLRRIKAVRIPLSVVMRATFSTSLASAFA